MRGVFFSLIAALLLVSATFGAINEAHGDKDVVPHEEQSSFQWFYNSQSIISVLDVDTIFRAIGVPFCMRQCIDPFINSTTSLWNMRDVVSQARKVCKLHSEALKCLKKTPFCDHNNIFTKASSSVEYMCAKKHVLFERMESCLNPVVDRIMTSEFIPKA